MFNLPFLFFRSNNKKKVWTNGLWVKLPRVGLCMLQSDWLWKSRGRRWLLRTPSAINIRLIRLRFWLLECKIIFFFNKNHEISLKKCMFNTCLVLWLVLCYNSFYKNRLQTPIIQFPVICSTISVSYTHLNYTGCLRCNKLKNQTQH